MELGYLGHRLSREGVSVYPRKVQLIVEWATQMTCAEVRRFTGLVSYDVGGYAEVAAPLIAFDSPQPDGTMRVDARDAGKLQGLTRGSH